MEEVRTAAAEGLASCHMCGKVSPVTDGHCPRCHSKLHLRKPHSLERTWSFLIAAMAFYFPANLLPMMSVTGLVGNSSDTILSGGGAGSRAGIRFTNELSSAFRVTRLLFVLDGAVQYNKTDQSGALAEQTESPVFNGSIPPGDHTLQVLINLQGNGYGVFSYLRGYKFEVRSSHSFTAVEGKTMNLQAVAYEKGGVTTPLEERPAIRYVEKIQSGLADPATTPAAAAK